MTPLQDHWHSHSVQAPLCDSAVVRLVVAFSGGADSTALLHLACQVPDTPIVALHINHQLHADAGDWQMHCRAQCELLGVTFESLLVSVKSGGSVEENARHARYRAFESFLGPGDLLLLAHHADDQLETALFNLFRGNAAVGLLGMPPTRVVGGASLYRPLLAVSGAELVAYCEQQKLNWIEDDSNLDASMDRGFLRQHLLPAVTSRWPGVRKTVMQAIERDVQARELLDAVARDDLSDAESGGGLSVDALLSLPASRRENLLGFWIRERGFAFPSVRLMHGLSRNLLSARGDAEPCVVWRGCELRRFRGRIYLMARHDITVIDTDHEFDTSCPLSLNVGTVRVIAGEGQGVRETGEPFSVRFRRGGERIRIRGSNRKLKKLLQENGVPPWLRDRLPLIFRGGQLVAVPGIEDWDVAPVMASDAVAGSQESGLVFWFDAAADLSP